MERLRKRTKKTDGDFQSDQGQEDNEVQMKSEGSLANECDLCGKIYSQPYKLKQHERLEHSVRIEHQCQACMNETRLDPLWREKAGIGEEVVHVGFGVPKEVREATKKFRIPDTRPQRHLIGFSSTGHAFHQCTVCFEKLKRCCNNRSHQRKHIDTMIGTEKAFQCKSCPQLFKNKKALQMHSSRSCSALTRSVPELLGMEYRCRWCFELLPNKTSLKRHLKYHQSLINSVTSTTATTTTTSSITTTTTATTTTAS